MKKKFTLVHRNLRCQKKLRILGVMRSLLVFMIFILLEQNAIAQDNPKLFTKSYSNASVQSILMEIQNESEYRFVFMSDDVKPLKKVTKDFKNATVEEILDYCLRNSGLDYEKDENAFVIFPKEKKKKNLPVKEAEETIVVSGVVTDEKGQYLPGATILIEGTTLGITSDVDGQFKMSVPGKNTVLKISYIGFSPQSVLVGDKTFFSIILNEATTNLKEFVVTGLFERKQESFTGNASTYEAEELKSMGNENVIKSLSLIDPSLNITENNILGSDPNTLPEVRLRGEAVFSTPGVESIGRTNLAGDPNLPIFILDDFETTLEKVFDLDMNRVESVTILKDAAATAMYGSRAANGVIVIKTIQPKSGQLKLSYNLNTEFSFPDLRSYDLLDAEELFQLQKDINILNFVTANRWKAAEIERLVQKGVNTDWLAQPVRNAIGQKHSLNFMGGDDHMRYMFDLNYQDRPGVMKESYRKNLGLALTLSYNLNDKLVFMNRLSVDKNTNENSPYGDFSVYTEMQPYLPIHDETGAVIERYSYYDDRDESYHYFPYYNPVYEAGIGNLDKTRYIDINNNFSVEWRMYPFLKLKANISYTHKSTENEWFRSPESYVYWGSSYDNDEKGEYEYTNDLAESYYGNAILSFIKDFNGHFVNASLAFNASENTYRVLGFSAQGFAAKNFADPAYAAGYGDGNLPVSYEGKTRLAGVLGSVNYSYKNRFLADFTYRMDGSSQFGTKDKTAGFFSTGLGWNLHKEKFLKGSRIINRLKLKGTYGETGSVNFSAYQAKDIVQYYKDIRYLDLLGTYLVGLGNENLKWQTTRTTDVGIEFGLFNDLVSGTFNYYIKKTTDMVIPVTTPPSLGFDSFMENLGEMENKGFEFYLRTNLIKKEDLRWNVYVSGSQNRSRILAIGNSLEVYNQISDRGGLSEDEVIDDDLYYDGESQAAASHLFLIRYEEGQSNTAIWAVRSLGIDPMTGKELFLDKDGNPTFVWDASDKVVVGDTEPDLRGIIGTNISYKGFDIGIVFSYEFGGQVYNYTLVNKIENSDKEYNVDRRVMDETWREPGDIVKYKLNYNLEKGYANETTPASSRFVQDYDVIRLSSLNINYNLPASFYKRFGMESMRLTLNMNDIFYWSTVKRERGFNYPYARSFTLSLRANF